jgi:hypothetical protein
MTWVINAAWYPLLSFVNLPCMALSVLVMWPIVRLYIRYCNRWCNFDISSVMWTHDILIMWSWLVCITGIPGGKPGSPHLSRRQYPPSTPNHHRTTAVPSQYSIRHKLHFSEKHFINQNPTQVKYGHSNRPWLRTWLFE